MNSNSNSNYDNYNIKVYLNEKTRFENGYIFFHFQTGRETQDCIIVDLLSHKEKEKDYVGQDCIDDAIFINKGESSFNLVTLFSDDKLYLTTRRGIDLHSAPAMVQKIVFEVLLMKMSGQINE